MVTPSHAWSAARLTYCLQSFHTIRIELNRCAVNRVLLYIWISSIDTLSATSVEMVQVRRTVKIENKVETCDLVNPKNGVNR